MDQFDDKWQRRQAKWARREARRAAHQHSGTHGVFMGGIIIAVGVLFLLDNMGIVRFHDVWQYWPAILIVFGVARIAESHGPAAIVFGGIIAGLGALLLLDNMGIVYFDWHMFWPLLIIAWGLMMLLKPRPWGGGPGQSLVDLAESADLAALAVPADWAAQWESAIRRPLTVSGSPTLGLWTIFGGGRRQIDSQDFRGGEVSAIFGGYEVDLRMAAIAQGEAVIDVTAVFGGVEIRVPETWTVEARGIGVFGGFGDETRPPRADQIGTPQRLIVTGTAAFGGVAIKNSSRDLRASNLPCIQSSSTGRD